MELNIEPLTAERRLLLKAVVRQESLVESWAPANGQKQPLVVRCQHKGN